MKHVTLREIFIFNEWKLALIVYADPYGAHNLCRHATSLHRTTSNITVTHGTHGYQPTTNIRIYTAIMHGYIRLTLIFSLLQHLLL